MKSYFEASRGLCVCAFLITRTRLFLTITAIINLAQFLIISACFENLKNGSIDFLRRLSAYEVKDNYCLLERPFKVWKNDIFLFRISFFLFSRYLCFCE